MAESENNSNSQGENQQNNSAVQQSVKDFLIRNKYDTILWLIRLYIIFSTFCYIVPILGVAYGRACFKRVLIGSAAISALRLNQRMPRVQFNMEFAKQLVLEDSFHYFIYSVLFLMSNATTMVLIPIFIFAIMHAAVYTRKVLNVNAENSNTIVLKLKDLLVKVEQQQTREQMLMFIATTEIMVLVVSIVMVFSGQSTILVPFFYYRFIQLRYSSRRNPYSRLMFNQFRVGIERLAYHPSCPGAAQKILLGVISIILRLSPATTPAS